MITTFIGTYEDLVEISGTSAKGAFTYWQLVVKHDSHPQYGDKLVAVSVWKSELLQEANRLAQNGQKLQLDCEVNAKPYEADGKKKYAVDIRCFRISPVMVRPMTQQPQMQMPMMQQAVAPQPQTYQAVAPQPQMMQQQPMQAQQQYIPSSGYPQQGGFTAPAMPSQQGYGSEGYDPNNPPF